VYAPYYDMLVPVTTPHKHVAMCSVESCMLKAPSLFAERVITHSTNSISIAGFEYFTDYIAPIFALKMNKDMSNHYEIIDFFMKFTTEFEGDVTITLGTGFEETQYKFTAEDNGTTYESKVYQVEADDSETPIDKPTEDDDLEQVFNRMLKTKFILHNESTTNDIILEGRWMKIFGLYTREGATVTIPSNGSVQCELNTTGYDYVNIHTNFSRAVFTCSGDSFALVPADMLWSIPIITPPAEVTYYHNHSSSGKIPYSTPVLDEIGLYFTDQWGDMLYDIKDYVIVLTLDFAEKEPAQMYNFYKKA